MLNTLVVDLFPTTQRVLQGQNIGPHEFEACALLWVRSAWTHGCGDRELADSRRVTKCIYDLALSPSSVCCHEDAQMTPVSSFKARVLPSTLLGPPGSHTEPMSFFVSN